MMISWLARRQRRQCRRCRCPRPRVAPVPSVEAERGARDADGLVGAAGTACNPGSIEAISHYPTARLEAEPTYHLPRNEARIPGVSVVQPRGVPLPAATCHLHRASRTERRLQKGGRNRPAPLGALRPQGRERRRRRRKGGLDHPASPRQRGEVRRQRLRPGERERKGGFDRPAPPRQRLQELDAGEHEVRRHRPDEGGFCDKEGLLVGVAPVVQVILEDALEGARKAKSLKFKIGAKRVNVKDARKCYHRYARQTEASYASEC